ncbi:hypothetical protein Pfo_012627 [Paulownia fortunei]|nr:hypothetical protein Pfo_012627 [Paulownia fortunei]
MTDYKLGFSQFVDPMDHPQYRSAATFWIFPSLFLPIFAVGLHEGVGMSICAGDILGELIRIVVVGLLSGSWNL